MATALSRLGCTWLPALVILVVGPLSSLLAEWADTPAVIAVGLGATGATLALLAAATMQSGYER